MRASARGLRLSKNFLLPTYHEVLFRVEPDRTLFLAVDEEAYVNLFEEPIGKLLVDSCCIQLIVFDPYTETIRQWIAQNPIAS